MKTYIFAKERNLAFLSRLFWPIFGATILLILIIMKDFFMVTVRLSASTGFWQISTCLVMGFIEPLKNIKVSPGLLEKDIWNECKAVSHMSLYKESCFTRHLKTLLLSTFYNFPDFNQIEHFKQFSLYDKLCTLGKFTLLRKCMRHFSHADCKDYPSPLSHAIRLFTTPFYVLFTFFSV